MPAGSGRFFAVWRDALGRWHRKFAIQELLGHSQITTTMRYAHLASGYARAAVMTLGATPGDTAESDEPRNRLQVMDK